MIHSFCRIGFTSRCEHQLLFGTVALPGGQAQYVRVPKAGGTLFRIPSTSFASDLSVGDMTKWKQLADTSLLLLSDILPTGCFAAIQTLQHPKLAPLMTQLPFPRGSLSPFPNGAKLSQLMADTQWPPIQAQDCELILVVVGLGPVGIVGKTLIFVLVSSIHSISMYSVPSSASLIYCLPINWLSRSSQLTSWKHADRKSKLFTAFFLKMHAVMENLSLLIPRKGKNSLKNGRPE